MTTPMAAEGGAAAESQKDPQQPSAGAAAQRLESWLRAIRSPDESAEVYGDEESFAGDIRCVLEALEAKDALLNTPELHDFGKAVVLEALHQRERWGPEHDSWKGPENWFWTLGYLGGKAFRSAIEGDTTKALHHTVTAAALLNNWHSAILEARER